MINLWKSIFLMELRKIITYRSDFWVNFIGRTFFSITLAYFLWNSIFESLGTKILNGYSMQNMIIYYLCAPLIFRIQQGSDIGTISSDIYDGNLNKYLLYPTNFYAFKIVTYLAYSFFYFIQLLLILGLYQLFFYDPTIFTFDIIKILLLIPVLLVSALTYFFLTSLAELCAFWADNIWSLNVILRFLAGFLGGVMIPLSFFPQFAQDLLSYTPFPYLISFPVSVLLNNISTSEYLFSLLILISWGAVFYILSQMIWNRGKYKYTGIGI